MKKNINHLIDDVFEMNAKSIKVKSVITKSSPSRLAERIPASALVVKNSILNLFSYLASMHLLCRRCLLDMVKKVMDKTKVFTPKCKTCQ